MSLEDKIQQTPHRIPYAIGLQDIIFSDGSENLGSVNYVMVGVPLMVTWSNWEKP